MVTIEHKFRCPSCGHMKEIKIEVSEEYAEKINCGAMDLKEATQPGTFQREVFISGMCYDCQEKVFNRPAPGHEEEWGERKDECPVCGCPLYEKNIREDKCPTCGCKISTTNAEMSEEDKQCSE